MGDDADKNIAVRAGEIARDVTAGIGVAADLASGFLSTGLPATPSYTPPPVEPVANVRTADEVGLPDPTTAFVQALNDERLENDLEDLGNVLEMELTAKAEASDDPVAALIFDSPPAADGLEGLAADAAEATQDEANLEAIFAPAPEAGAALPGEAVEADVGLNVDASGDMGIGPMGGEPGGFEGGM
ncbi:MAG TPA: hypothetical protein VK988_18830 [Acidimicrobiales bacterium]|nr:hypothetical protein [Acidimicrobiales bacterium]